MKENTGRIGAERGREIWYLVTSENRIVDKFRNKVMAEKMKKYYYNNYGWGLEVKRNTQYNKEVKNEKEKGMSKV